MDTAESQSTNEPSTSTSIAEYNRNRSMDQISSPAGLRSMNTPAALYLANEMSPEMVMSDLNIYSKLELNVVICIAVAFNTMAN